MRDAGRRENNKPGIYIGLGANLPSPRHGPPKATLEAALAALAARGIVILQRSRWYESAPVPRSDQPWFVNAVIEIKTDLSPRDLLTQLNEVESVFGRVRGGQVRGGQVRAQANAPRIIDLDLLAYGGEVNPGPTPPILPHPRMTARAFVLLPLRELAPHWRHPVLGRDIDSLIADLAPDQEIRLA